MPRFFAFVEYKFVLGLARKRSGFSYICAFYGETINYFLVTFNPLP
jgi:hypothetical protein